MGRSFEEINSMLDLLFEGAYRVDLNRKILHWNPAAEQITGFSREEVLGHYCAENILQHVDEEGRSLCRGGCPLSAAMSGKGAKEVAVYLHHKQGHRVPIKVRCTPLRDESGNVIGGLEVFSSDPLLDQLQEKLEKLRTMAYLDSLTAIPNRRFCQTVLEQRSQAFDRYQWPFAVFLGDIDHFKIINDSFGHQAGDAVLKMVSNTLSANIRPMDHVGRWGGDEFLGILPNVSGEQLGIFVERLRLLVEKSFVNIDGQRHEVTMSFGVIEAREAEALDDVLAEVDAKLYTSKAAGRNCVTI
jgi:diguanylate cyclase (GGDEF)-like protein/PAS domain S-box-containing protein